MSGEQKTDEEDQRGQVTSSSDIARVSFRGLEAHAGWVRSITALGTGGSRGIRALSLTGPFGGLKVQNVNVK